MCDFVKDNHPADCPIHFLTGHKSSFSVFADLVRSHCSLIFDLFDLYSRFFIYIQIIKRKQVKIQIEKNPPTAA